MEESSQIWENDELKTLKIEKTNTEATWRWTTTSSTTIIYMLICAIWRLPGMFVHFKSRIAIKILIY